MSFPKANLVALYLSLVINLLLVIVVTIKMQRSPTDVYRAVLDLTSKSQTSIERIAKNQEYILSELQLRGDWMDQTNQNIHNLQVVAAGIVKRENDVSLKDIEEILQRVETKLSEE